MTRWFVRYILSPLIRRDHKLRKAGEREDNWYWAEQLAIRLDWDAIEYD